MNETVLFGWFWFFYPDVLTDASLDIAANVPLLQKANIMLNISHFGLVHQKPILPTLPTLYYHNRGFTKQNSDD